MALVYMQNVAFLCYVAIEHVSDFKYCHKKLSSKNSVADSLTHASSFVIIKELIKCVQ
jgi:hypothetical protein